MRRWVTRDSDKKQVVARTGFGRVGRVDGRVAARDAFMRGHGLRGARDGMGDVGYDMARYGKVGKVGAPGVSYRIGFVTYAEGMGRWRRWAGWGHVEAEVLAHRRSACGCGVQLLAAARPFAPCAGCEQHVAEERVCVLEGSWVAGKTASCAAGMGAAGGAGACPSPWVGLGGSSWDGGRVRPPMWSSSCSGCSRGSSCAARNPSGLQVSACRLTCWWV